jgi:hypothetical protein
MCVSLQIYLRRRLLLVSLFCTDIWRSGFVQVSTTVSWYGYAAHCPSLTKIHFDSQKKGKYTRLVGRHANYNIGFKAAERWVHHMKEAINNHDSLDEETRQCMVKYFSYTAHYIVVASEYMRPDQVRCGCVMFKYKLENVRLNECAPCS